jgi:hypothetical protein
MKIIWIVIFIIGLTIITFLVYRYFKFKQESKQHLDQKYERVKPIFDKINNGETLLESDVFPFAKNVLTREMTFQILVESNKTNLFPKEYYTIEKSAESNLCNWLLFPTELDACPDEIEYLKKVTIDFDGNNVYYYVFKFRVNEPHWAAKNGWMLGVVGPFFNDSNPYDFPSATFSRLSKLEEVKPEDEVKWVHENISLRK